MAFARTGAYTSATTEVAVPRLLLLLIVTLAAGALLVGSMPSRSASAESIVEGLGDVDCSGAVNAIDALLVLQHTAGLLDSLPCPAGADVSNDGQVNSRDASLILQYGARLISHFLGEVDPATILALDAQTGEELWRAELPIASPSKPVLDGGLLLMQGGKDCNSTRGLLMALDAASGQERWRMPVDNGDHCADMTLSSVGGVAVVQNSGSAVGVDIRDGSVLWEHPLAPANDNSDGHVLRVDSGSVALVREGSVFRALNRRTGEELWAIDAGPYEGGREVNATTLFLTNWRAPVSARSAASVAGASLVPCGLTAIELANGNLRWSVPGVLSGCASGVGATDQLAVTCSSANVIDGVRHPATVYALDSETGAEQWHHEISCYGVEVDATNVYVQPANEPPGPTLTALDPTTGAERWYFDGPEMTTGGFVTDSAHVFAFSGYADPIVVSLDAKTGQELWERTLPGLGSPYAHATVAGGVIYIAATGWPIPLNKD